MTGSQESQRDGSLNFIVRDGRAGRRSAYTAAIGRLLGGNQVPVRMANMHLEQSRLRAG